MAGQARNLMLGKQWIHGRVFVLALTLLLMLTPATVHSQSKKLDAYIKRIQDVWTNLGLVLDPVTSESMNDTRLGDIYHVRGRQPDQLAPGGIRVLVTAHIYPTDELARAPFDKEYPSYLDGSAFNLYPNKGQPLTVGDNLKAVVMAYAWHAMMDYTECSDKKEHYIGRAEGKFVCGRLAVSVLMQKADTVPRLDAQRSASNEKIIEMGRELVGPTKEWVKKVAHALQSANACEDQQPTVACQPPPAITSQRIDATLDFYARLLQFAVGKAETYKFKPSVEDKSPFPFTPKDAADLGRAVWDQTHGLQKRHVEREVTLNDAQKKRTKAFGHWAAWLEWRAKTRSINYRGELIDVYEQPEKPPYPLFGPIAQDVPTPPQLKGEDIFIVKVPWWGHEAITDDYAWAAFWTIAQTADMWYTRGLLWTAYVAYTNPSIAPVALSALQRIPYIGPVFTAAFVTAVELNSWTEIGLLRKYLGEGPLTWNQHLANYCTLSNLVISGALRTFPSLNRVRSIDQGKIGDDITKQFGPGKSFRILSKRTDAQGNKYQKIEYALVGKTEADPKNSLSFPTKEFRVVNTPDGARYFTVKANGELDQPVFFLGQKGYHEWKHLTEINAGQKTYFEEEALLNIFAGEKKYLDMLQAIEKTMRDPTQSLDTASNLYQAFANRLIADKSYTSVRGFYQWIYRDKSLAPPEANFFVMVQKDCGSNAPTTTYPVRVSIDPTNGRLMGLFVLPRNPTTPFRPETAVTVVQSAYWAWARDVDKYLYEFAPLRNYMPAR